MLEVAITNVKRIQQSLDPVADIYGRLSTASVYCGYYLFVYYSAAEEK